MSGSIPPSSPPTLPSTPQPPKTATITINGNIYSVKVFVGDTQQSLTKSKIEQLRTAILDAVNNLEKKEKKSTLDAKKFTILCSDSANASLQAENEEHSYTISATKAKGIWNAVHGTRTPSPDALKASDDGGSVTEDSDIDSVDYLDIEKLPLPKEIELAGYTFIYGEKTPKTSKEALLFTHDNKEYYVEVDKAFPSSLRTRLQAELETERANLDLQICTAIEHLFFYEKQCDVLDNPDSLRGIVGMNKDRMPRTVNVQCTLIKDGAPTPKNAHRIKYEDCTYAITIDGTKPDAALLNTIHLENIDGSVPVGIVNLIGRALQSGDGSDTVSNRSLPEADPPRRERSDSVRSITSRPASPTEFVRAFSSVTLPDGFSVDVSNYKSAKKFFDKNIDTDREVYFVKNAGGGFSRTYHLDRLSEKDSFICCKLPIADPAHTKTEGMLDTKQAFSLLGILSEHQNTFQDATDFKRALYAARSIVCDAPDMELNPTACARDFIKNMEQEPMSEEEKERAAYDTVSGEIQVGNMRIQLRKAIQKSSLERIINYFKNTPDTIPTFLENYHSDAPMPIVKRVRVHYDFSGKVIKRPTEETDWVDVELNPLYTIQDVNAAIQGLTEQQCTFTRENIGHSLNELLQGAKPEGGDKSQTAEKSTGVQEPKNEEKKTKKMR